MRGSISSLIAGRALRSAPFFPRGKETGSFLPSVSRGNGGTFFQSKMVLCCAKYTYPKMLFADRTAIRRTKPDPRLCDRVCFVQTFCLYRTARLQCYCSFCKMLLCRSTSRKVCTAFLSLRRGTASFLLPKARRSDGTFSQRRKRVRCFRGTRKSALSNRAAMRTGQSRWQPPFFF